VRQSVTAIIRYRTFSDQTKLLDHARPNDGANHQS
jgi:hypothetical protein